MKIGDYVKTSRNGLYGSGLIVDKKVLDTINGTIILFKVDSVDFGVEWINEAYLEKV